MVSKKKSIFQKVTLYLKSLFKKLVELEGPGGENPDDPLNSSCSGQESSDTYLSGRSDYIDNTDNIYKELIFLLCNVMDTLNEHGKAQEFVN